MGDINWTPYYEELNRLELIQALKERNHSIAITQKWLVKQRFFGSNEYKRTFQTFDGLEKGLHDAITAIPCGCSDISGALVDWKIWTYRGGELEQWTLERLLLEYKWTIEFIATQKAIKEQEAKQVVDNDLKTQIKKGVHAGLLYVKLDLDKIIDDAVKKHCEDAHIE